MKQWTISRKPNCISNARVGSSETIREAHIMMNLGLILIESLLSEYDEDIVQPLLKDNGTSKYYIILK